MSGACPPEFVDLALRLADAAGEVARRYFRAPIGVEAKADATPVTVADREAELAMRGLIEASVPAHGIQGEEFGAARLDAEWVWHLDPIDGNKSFVTGSPLFGTLIALRRHGAPVLGLIDQPILRERWLASGSEPTRLNGAAVRTRSCPDPKQAVLFTSGLEHFREGRTNAFWRIFDTVRFTRTSADCYAYGLLACGFVDLVMEADMKPHDYAALVPVVQNAGGVITDWHGRPLGFDGPHDVLAAGDPALHARILALMQA